MCACMCVCMRESDQRVTREGQWSFFHLVGFDLKLSGLVASALTLGPSPQPPDTFLIKEVKGALKGWCGE